jgi:hypothetical protein
MNLRNKKIVHVGIALDQSGSMDFTKKQTISGLNEQIQELKKHKDIDTTITWVTFSGPSDVEVVYSVVPVNSIVEIDDKSYNPNGTTAMFDGVARLLNEMSQKINDDLDTTYLILVVSDGEENSSVEYDSKKIAEMIKERKDSKRWTIIYIGANQDLSQVQEILGIDASNMLGYTSTPSGTAAGWNCLASSTTRYMSSRSSLNNSQASYTVLAANFVNSDSETIVSADDKTKEQDKK